MDRITRRYYIEFSEETAKSLNVPRFAFRDMDVADNSVLDAIPVWTHQYADRIYHFIGNRRYTVKDRFAEPRAWHEVDEKEITLTALRSVKI